MNRRWFPCLFAQPQRAGHAVALTSIDCPCYQRAMALLVVSGRSGVWHSLAETEVNAGLYRIACVDFETFDLSQADVAMPLSLRDVRLLRRHHAAQKHKFLLPGEEVAALCHDKQALNERLLQTRFAELIPPMREKTARRLPYVLKKRESLSGLGTFIVRTAEDEAMLREQIESDRYFGQDYVEGTVEYTAHMLMAEGALLYHSSNRYRMAPHLVKGNHGVPVEELSGVEPDAGVIEIFTEVLRLIGFEGPCCIDYKFEGQRLRLLEINPRCGFTLFRDINRFLGAYCAALGLAAEAPPSQASRASPGQDGDALRPQAPGQASA